MNKWGGFVAAVAGVVLMPGCDSGYPGDDARDPATYTFAASQSTFTDAELLYVAYAPEYEAPEGMYEDEYNPLHYVTTLHVGRAAEGWRELCTDDSAEARAWLDTHFGGSDLGEHEDPKFFQFARSDVAMHYISPTYFRVHRCAYVDVYDYVQVYDDSNYTAERGTFNLRPLAAEAVQDLAEYLWYIRYRNFSHYGVLSSFTDELPDAFQHTLYYVTFVGGDWGTCDIIGLQRRVTTVDKVTGAIVEGNETIRTVEGRCY
jgi:hypothetical protein